MILYGNEFGFVKHLSKILLSSAEECKISSKRLTLNQLDFTEASGKPAMWIIVTDCPETGMPPHNA